MLRIRQFHGTWQVIRRKKYGNVEVVFQGASEAEARAYIQRYG